MLWTTVIRNLLQIANQLSITEAGFLFVLFTSDEGNSFGKVGEV